MSKFHDLKNEREEIDFKEDALLRKAGWEHTSSLGCIWLWKKKIGKETVYVNKATAIWFVENDWMFK